MLEDSMNAANELLSAHALAAIRLHAWEPTDKQACFEVFHLEWPDRVLGELRFCDVSYVQCPTSTSWGYRLRVSPSAPLPSRGDGDPADVVFELFSPDGQEPSAFVVAASLQCVTHAQG